MGKKDFYYVYDQEYLMPWRLDKAKRQAYDIAVNSSEEIKECVARLKEINDEGLIWFRNYFVSAYMEAKKRLVADAYNRSLHHAANMALFNVTRGHLGYSGYRSRFRRSSR